MPEVRLACATCAIGSDIYVFGGIDDNSVRYASVFKYDTLTDEWSTLAPMPQPSSFHTASVLDGSVFIVGAGDNHCGVWRFDPTSGVWSTLAPTMNDRDYGASFALGGCVYAAGGIRSASSLERYNVASDTWTAVADMLEGRDGFRAVVLGCAGPTEELDLFDSLIAKASSGHP
jgi:hypothetical protein